MYRPRLLKLFEDYKAELLAEQTFESSIISCKKKGGLLPWNRAYLKPPHAIKDAYWIHPIRAGSSIGFPSSNSNKSSIETNWEAGLDNLMRKPESGSEKAKISAFINKGLPIKNYNIENKVSIFNERH